MAEMTEAQARVLRIIGKRDDDLWCNYGGGCGIGRHSAMALARKGLAEYEHTEIGVSVRITPAGRAALAQPTGDRHDG